MPIIFLNKIIEINFHPIIHDDNIIFVIGSNSAISKSKIMTVKMYRNENVNRAEFFGSNSHTNGDDFS